MADNAVFSYADDLLHAAHSHRIDAGASFGCENASQVEFDRTRRCRAILLLRENLMTQLNLFGNDWEWAEYGQCGECRSCGKIADINADSCCIVCDDILRES